MKMIRKIVIVLVVLTCGVLLVIQASGPAERFADRFAHHRFFAGDPGGTGFRPGPAIVGRHLKKVARVLELDEAQREAVKALLEEHREETVALMTEMKESARQVRELLESKSSAAEVGAKVNSVHELRQKLRSHREDIQVEFEELLTEEQLIKYQTVKELVHVFKGRHGRWGHRGHLLDSYEDHGSPER
jgi:Spy/CpxP family protein refolding chaperone